jgi:hypothetical protein
MSSPSRCRPASVRPDREAAHRYVRDLNRHAAITAALFLWGAAGARLDDVVVLHDVVSVMAPWLALFLVSALIRPRRPPAVFVSTALGSVGGVVAYYAWRDLAGQGLYVPGLLLWTAAALAASGLMATFTLWTRRRPSVTATAFLAGGGFAIGEAIGLAALSGRDASTVLATGADVAIALLLVWLARREQAPEGAPRRPVAARLHRVGWLGSGAAFFWIVLFSIRALAP